SPLRRALAIGTAWAAFGLAGGAAFAQPASTPAAASGAAAAPVAQSADAALVKRGEYLARAGDCIACHTANGGKPFAGGLKFDTPIGGIYSTNITPDP
ncbi:cytochrome c, partial [Burkholderia cenocepacia]|nr:cytochrome c [Burkholderia cenocepacia]